MDIVFLIVGLLVGFITAFLFFLSKNKKNENENFKRIKEAETEFLNAENELETKLAVLEEKLTSQSSEFELLKQTENEKDSTIKNLEMEKVRFEEEKKNYQEKAETLKADFENSQAKFNAEIETFKQDLKQSKLNIEELKVKEIRLEEEKKSFFDKIESQKSEIESVVISSKEEKTKLQTEIEQFKLGEQESNQLIQKASMKQIQLEEENKSLIEKLETQKAEFEELRKKFNTEFENIANRIFKKNSEEFVNLNKKNITEILFPLNEKIVGFEKKVNDTYEKGLKDQTDLRAELKKLYSLNERISSEANNLTKALKGDVKKQGNWGEVVLERILERSGLEKGREYEREIVIKNSENETIRPDVIVYLPDKKHIVIDSKVSLVAYERFVNSDDTEERKKNSDLHIAAIKSHIKRLSEKHYQSSPELNTPDFILLFVPLESMFSLAVQMDQDIFNYAWDNKIVIVSPSTLFATLKTIASIWQQENLTQNALEISRQGASLYDKFVGFLSDLDNIGKSIEKAGEAYSKAKNKLYDGRGNLIRSVEKIKKLGAKTNKEIPSDFLDKAE